MRKIFVFVTCSIFLVSLVVDLPAQRKDHLTKEEIELVRDFQDVDQRMEIFAKAIDRRFLVIQGTSSLSEKEQKALEKDKKKWGELPKGSKSKMISDIAGILNESIDKIDDVYDREPKNKFIPYAVHHIGDYCSKLVPRLRSLADTVDTREDRGSLLKSYDHCSKILEAQKKVPKPPKKKPKRKQRF